MRDRRRENKAGERERGKRLRKKKRIIIFLYRYGKKGTFVESKGS